MAEPRDPARPPEEELDRLLDTGEVTDDPKLAGLLEEGRRLRRSFQAGPHAPDGPREAAVAAAVARRRWVRRRRRAAVTASTIVLALALVIGVVGDFGGAPRPPSPPSDAAPAPSGPSPLEPGPAPSGRSPLADASPGESTRAEGSRRAAPAPEGSRGAAPAPDGASRTNVSPLSPVPVPGRTANPPAGGPGAGVQGPLPDGVERSPSVEGYSEPEIVPLEGAAESGAQEDRTGRAVRDATADRAAFTDDSRAPEVGGLPFARLEAAGLISTAGLLVGLGFALRRLARPGS